MKSLEKRLYSALFGKPKRDRKDNAQMKKTSAENSYEKLLRLIEENPENHHLTSIYKATEWYELIREAMEIEDAAPINLFVHGITHKAQAITKGYVTLTRSGNYICAISLIRILLDCALLAWAGLAARNRDQFFLAYNAGTPINRLEDKNGNKLTQGFIVRTLSEQNPAVKEIFDDASGFVHTSRAAQDGSIDLTNEVRLLSYESFQTPERARKKANEQMRQANDILITILAKWVKLKHGEEISLSL